MSNFMFMAVHDSTKHLLHDIGSHSLREEIQLLYPIE